MDSTMWIWWIVFCLMILAVVYYEFIVSKNEDEIRRLENELDDEEAYSAWLEENLHHFNTFSPEDILDYRRELWRDYYNETGKRERKLPQQKTTALFTLAKDTLDTLIEVPDGAQPYLAWLANDGKRVEIIYEPVIEDGSVSDKDEFEVNFPDRQEDNPWTVYRMELSDFRTEEVEEKA